MTLHAHRTSRAARAREFHEPESFVPKPHGRQRLVGRHHRRRPTMPINNAVELQSNSATLSLVYNSTLLRLLRLFVLGELGISW